MVCSHQFGPIAVIVNSLENVVENSVIVDKNESDHVDNSKKAIRMPDDFDIVFESKIVRIAVVVGCNCFGSLHHHQQV